MARQWQVARVNMKAVKNFEEGKETTEVNPTEEQGDKAPKIKVSSKTTISSKKKIGWTFFPSASLEESLGRGGAGRLWSFVPGDGLEQTKQSNGLEMELDRMELSSVLRPEPGQLLGQVWFFQNFTLKSQNRFGRRQQGGFTGCSMHLRMRKRRSLGAQPPSWEDSHLSLASLPLLLLGLYF